MPTSGSGAHRRRRRRRRNRANRRCRREEEAKEREEEEEEEEEGPDISATNDSTNMLKLSDGSLLDLSKVHLTTDDDDGHFRLMIVYGEGPLDYHYPIPSDGDSVSSIVICQMVAWTAGDAGRCKLSLNSYKRVVKRMLPAVLGVDLTWVQQQFRESQPIDYADCQELGRLVEKIAEKGTTGWTKDDIEEVRVAFKEVGVEDPNEYLLHENKFVKEDIKYDVKELLLSSKVGMNNNGNRKAIVKLFKAVGWMNRQINEGKDARDGSDRDPEAGGGANRRHDDEERERQRCDSRARRRNRHTALSLLAGVLSEGDDLNQVMEWFDHGKIDAMHLAKVMPKTAEDLRKCRTDPERLLDGMKRAVNSTLLIQIPGIEVEEGGNLLSSPAFEGTLVELMGVRLSTRTIPRFWCRNAVQEQWLAQAHRGFARDLTSRFESEGLDQLYAGSEILAYANIAPPVQDILSQVCNEWAQRVDDALFKGRSGTFVFLCPTNALSGESSIDMVRRIFHEGRDKEYDERKSELGIKKDQLKQAINAVAIGAHEALNTCWECEAAGVRLFRCLRCKVAHYCGPDCQRRAFNTGHKKMCTVLKEKRDAFLGSVEAVNRAHKTGKLEGIRLSYYLDYIFASESFEYWNPYPEWSTGQDSETHSVSGPSMKYFYENFGRVLRGEWWLYSSTLSMEAYRSQLGGTLRGGSKDWEHFCMLFICLSYDVFGSVDEEAMPELLDNSYVKHLKDKWLAMPAARFIELYKNNAWYYSYLASADVNAKNRLRSNKKAETLLFFRKQYHK